MSRRILTADERAAADAYLTKASGLLLEIRQFAPLALAIMDTPKSPQLQFRMFADLLEADARLRVAKGELGDSIADIDALMQFAAALAAGTKTIDQYSRFAVEGRVFDVLQIVIGADSITESKIGEMMSQLPRGYSRELFADSLATESCDQLGAMDRLRETGEGADGMVQGARVGAGLGSGISGNPAPSELSLLLNSLEIRLYASPLGRPWQNMDQQAYAESMERVIEAAYQPLYQAITDPAAFEHANQGGAILGNVRAYRLLSHQATHEAELDLARMGLLLRGYRVRHGVYPAALDAIAPDMGGTLPKDPYSGNNYIYRASSEGFILYSVGWNRQDDGGKEGYYDGDIVWRVGKS